MRVLNKDYTDMSPEMILQLVVALECVFATEIICYKASDILDQSIESKALYKDQTLFQQKKRNARNARKYIQAAIRELESSFDDTLNKVYNKIEGQELVRCEAVHGLANDIVHLLLIIFAKTDGNPAKRESVKKALMNYKNEWEDLDLKELLKFYKYNE